MRADQLSSLGASPVTSICIEVVTDMAMGLDIVMLPLELKLQSL